MKFTIFPAIDLKNGKCVRLRQGRADDETVYGDDPAAQAVAWEKAGAEELHVVDLDGAFRGAPAQLELVRAMVAAVKIPVEIGGGIRTDADAEEALSTGVARVILGTRALAHPEALGELAVRYGKRLAIGIDARDGFVQGAGWTETSGVKAANLAALCAKAGVRRIIYTDTATDGMLRGPNFAAVAEACDAAGAMCEVVASGGISSAEDIRRLKALGKPNLVGAIVGKALYDGVATLPDLLSAAAE